MNQTCPIHANKPLGWICLSKNCPSRVMCSVCAVKTHQKQHQIEEIDSFSKQGLLNLMQITLNKTSSKQVPIKHPQDAQPKIQNELEKQIDEADCSEMIKVLQQSISSVIDFAKKHSNTIEKEYSEMLILKKKQQETTITQILLHENKVKNSNSVSEIQEELDKAIELAFSMQTVEQDDEEQEQYEELIMSSFKNGKSIQLAEAGKETSSKAATEASVESTETIPSLESQQNAETCPKQRRMLFKKKQMLKQLRSSFLVLTNNYLKNTYTEEICKLVKKQMDLVASTKEEKQLESLQVQWKNDYLLFQEALTQSLAQLEKRLLRSFLLTSSDQAVRLPINQNSRIHILSQPNTSVQPQMCSITQLKNQPQLIAGGIQPNVQLVQNNQFQDMNGLNQQLSPYLSVSSYAPEMHYSQPTGVATFQQISPNYGYGQSFQNQQYQLNQSLHQPQYVYQGMIQSTKATHLVHPNRVQQQPQINQIDQQFQYQINQRELANNQPIISQTANLYLATQKPNIPDSNPINKAPANNLFNTPNQTNKTKDRGTVNKIQTTPYSHQKNLGTSFIQKDIQEASSLETQDRLKKKEPTQEQDDPLSPIHFIQLKSNSPSNQKQQ